MKKIGIYPGNFQPAARSHLEVYKKLKYLVGDNDVFVVTTDREPIPEAPLNFGDKEQIWVRHGVPISHIIKLPSLPTDDTERASDWRPTEVYHRFSALHTAAIIVMNEKEVAVFSKRKKQSDGTDGMSGGLSQKTKRELHEIFEELNKSQDYDPEDEDPDTSFLKKNEPHEEKHKEIWLAPDGNPLYFQPYKGNEHDLKPFEEHAYVVIIDDSKIQGKPISTTNIRNVLGSSRYNDSQKKKFFRWVFGWFDVGLYQLMSYKFRQAHQVVSIEDEPPTPSTPGLTTRVNQPNQPVSTPQPNPQSRIYNPKRKLEELVIDILNEEYPTTDSVPDVDMSSAIDSEEKSLSQQHSDSAKQRQDLVKTKKELESKAKQNKQQRDNYSTTVKNYDQFQKKTDRDAITAVNKQISQPTKPTSPIA